jgi:hypothetical protein
VLTPGGAGSAGELPWRRARRFLKAGFGRGTPAMVGAGGGTVSGGRGRHVYPHTAEVSGVGNREYGGM